MKFTSGRIINTDLLVALKIRNSNIYNLLNKKNSGGRRLVLKPLLVSS